jgi:hypothetical protein
MLWTSEWRSSRGILNFAGLVLSRCVATSIAHRQTILSPRSPCTAELLDAFRQQILNLFNQHISRNGSDAKKGPSVYLDDAILQCLICLSSKCKDEELDDLLYFILDIYQFHGNPVAISELDTDMVSVTWISNLPDRCGLAGYPGRI